jgi:sialidase-1
LPEHTVVFQSGTNGYHTFRIPAIVKANDGQLIAICEGRRNGRGDSGDIDIVCRRSSDQGRTWSPIQIIWDDQGNTCGNPCPVVDRLTGNIWLPLTHNSGDDDEKEIKSQTGVGTRTVWISNSADHGATWSKPIDVTSSTKAENWTWYATGPGAGIQLERGTHKGRLVIPCDHNGAGTMRRGAHAIYSDDHGATWVLGRATPEREVNECEVVELSNSRLLLNMRNYDRSVPARQIAVSDDGGHSWGEQRHDPTLIEPVCQASIRRARWPSDSSPGLILFANPASRNSRSRMTVRGSVDDGKSWPYARLLYSGSSAYSCLVALDSETAACLFEIDDYGKIVFAPFTHEWIESGVPPANPPN